MTRVAVLTIVMLAAVALAADKKTYRYNCRGGAFTVTAVVEASGRWSKADPVVLQIDSEPPQTLVADPDAPDADSFKNKDYEFYALKNFVRLTKMSHGVVVKTYNACRAEWSVETP
jgi:hypothetical protein